MSMQGVSGEDRIELDKEQAKAVRLRSRRLLISLIRPLRRRYLFSFAVIVVSQLLRVLGPTLIAIGIDQSLPLAMEGNWLPIIEVVVGYLSAAMVTAWLTAFFLIYAARLNQDILLELRKRIFEHTQRLSIEFHETYTSGRIIARQTSDLDAIRELFDSAGNEMVAGILFMAFTMTALATLDLPSFGFLCISLIPLYFITRWFQKSTKLNFRKTRLASARLIVHFVETMTGIRAVKAFRKEKVNNEKYAELVEDYRFVNGRVIQLFGIYDPALILIGNITVAGVLLFGGLRVLDGTLGVGILTAAILYARRFYDPMEGLAMFYNAFQSANSALEKISGVLEQELSVEEPKNPIDIKSAKGEVVFDKVEFHYSNGKTVLPEFNLRIVPGEVIALVGTTGAGKSTLAKLVSRFYDPTHGSVSLDGVDLRNISHNDLRRAIVLVTQEAYLFSGSVAENIALGKPDATAEEIEVAAKAVGAHEFILGLPQGYSTDVNKRGGRVSAGQRQLISFARAFIANPAVLILDEATSSLDIPSERMVQNGLKTLLSDRTAIIIAHRLSTVSIADRVLVLEHGRVIEDGTPKKLISGSGKFSKMHKAWRESLV